ncbi:MAG: penicillin-binding transpeptidase domain-containing protein [Sporolactobacillus sp.]
MCMGTDFGKGSPGGHKQPDMRIDVDHAAKWAAMRAGQERVGSMASRCELSTMERDVLKFVETFAPLTINEVTRRCAQRDTIDQSDVHRALNALETKGLIVFDGSEDPFVMPVIDSTGVQDCELAPYCVFSPRRVKYASAGTIFGHFRGCFVLLDPLMRRYTIVSRFMRATQRRAPDSTYKVLSALAGLEHGIIRPEASTLELRRQSAAGTYRQKLDLSAALQQSVNDYFQILDRRIGAEKLLTFYTRLGYGNCNLSGPLGGYWYNSTLMISPVEQVQVLQKVFGGSLPFKAENIRALKAGLKVAETDGTLLYGKTGTGFENEKTVNGWFVGAVDQMDHCFFFAANIEGEDGASGERAKAIALTFLKAAGLYHQSITFK